MSKRGSVLELAVLGLLHESPLHGYELRKRLNDHARRVPGLLLRLALPLPEVAGRPGPDRRGRRRPPTTRRAAARPPSGPRSSTGSRPTARSTSRTCSPRPARPPGRTRTSASTSPSSARPTPTCACASSRAAARRLEERLENVRTSVSRTRERLDSYTLELQQHGLESVEREVRWLNELIIDRAQPAPDRTDRRHHRQHRHRRDDPVRRHCTQRTRSNRMGSVRVAIVGVGNCASSLVQGVEYYKDADPNGTVPGLMHVQFGEYHVRDVEFVAAFDVDAKKVGQDLVRRDRRQREQHDQDLRRAADRRHRAARPHPRRSRQVLPRDDHRVRRGAGRRRRSTLKDRRSTSSSATCPSAPRRPRSSTRSAPSTPRSRSSTRSRSSSPAPRSGRTSSPTAGVPIVGDDIKSQVGATITHRVLAKLFEDRGVTVDRTYQLNVGGNMDFMNMLERERLESKKISKTQSVTSQLQAPIDAAQRAHRPVRLRRVARRPQVGVRPPRGSQLRRRPAAPRVQARGVGLPELGRHHHRRDPRREDRQGPRHRRPDPVGLVVLHEVAAGAVHRRRLPRQGRSSSSAARSTADPLQHEQRRRTRSGTAPLCVGAPNVARVERFQGFWPRGSFTRRVQQAVRPSTASRARDRPTAGRCCTLALCRTPRCPPPFVAALRQRPWRVRPVPSALACRRRSTEVVLANVARLNAWRRRGARSVRRVHRPAARSPPRMWIAVLARRDPKRA